MKTLMIIVPVPHRALSPNARVHWGTLSSKKTKARWLAKTLAEEAFGGKSAPKWKRANVNVAAYFKDRRSKWDADNFIASLKATMDGLADAGVFENDRGVVWGTVDLIGIDKDEPRVVLTITGARE